MRILVCYAYHHTSSHYFDKSGVHDNHLAYLAFSFLQVAKFFSAEFRDPRMSGKVRQQYDHEVPSCRGPHLQDGMKELLSVGIRSWHFMSIDMLSTVFMSIVHQQREIGEPYHNPKHTAMQWKWVVNKVQDESANQLSKHLGMQTFIGSWVYPACLRNTAYADYAFPMQGPYYNQPVPYPLTHGSARVHRSIPPGAYPSDSPTAVTATAQQDPAAEGREPVPCQSPTKEMGFTVRQAEAVDQAIATQHAEATERARTREIELATRQAAATAAQQAAAAKKVVATQALVSETPAHPGIQVPGQLQRTYLTEALVERTPKEQEQFNYSLTLSHNLSYSPDDDVSVIRSPGNDWGEASTVTTDTEMTDAMTGFTLDSLADNREILYSQTGMGLGPCPGAFPNLQMQMELDKLRRGDS